MKIVLATGGSAGHLFPAIETAKCLRTDGHEVIFIGTFGAGKNRISDEGFKFEDIKAKGLQGKSRLADVKAVWSLILAALQAISKLKIIKPHVVAGFGGYGAFPVVSAAVILRIPAVIHEQNAVPGRANRLLNRFVKKTAISFKTTENYLAKRNLVYTGCPIVRSSKSYDRMQTLKEFGLNQTDKIVLVFGGSQGSQTINQVFCEALTKGQTKLRIQVVHISGKGKLAELRLMYQSINQPHILFEFFEPMEKLYQLADLVISRSGASTVNELTWYKKPAVLIPYPHAGGHQKVNAAFFAEKGTAQVIDEKDLTGDHLSEAIIRLLENPPSDNLFDEMIKDLNIDNSAKTLAGEIVQSV